MEKLNLAQSEKGQERDQSLRDRIRRGLVYTVAPLALLAAGCGGQASPKPNSVSEGHKIESNQYDQNIENMSNKMLRDCLIRVAGSPEDIKLMDNGDLIVRAGGENYYLLDSEAKEKVLSVVMEHIPSTELGRDFRRAEEKMQTTAVKQAVRNFGQLLSQDQLPKELQNMGKSRQSLSDQLNHRTTGSESKQNSGPQVWTSPDAKDFL